LEYSKFREILSYEDWFKVYEITPSLFVFYEPRHYEETIVNLVIGEQKAVLIDTGCGIGDLRKAVEAITTLPVMVVNTHTHLDHLGSNRQFDDIAMFDHPLSRRTATYGADPRTLQTDLMSENLITKPWPQGFDLGKATLPPFKVSRWLKDGEQIDLGGRTLEVIYTPGEATNHICLLDRTNRILFCGDILLHGPIWTHMEGGSLQDLATSYRRLMDYFDAFDYLMPGHNEPWLDKNLLPKALDGADKIMSGQAAYQEIVDPWNRHLKQYSFGRFSILTR